MQNKRYTPIHAQINYVQTFKLQTA